MTDTRRPVIVVLDDDPTGIQTVKDVPVFMDWDEEIIADAYQTEPGFFIQTNSRAMGREEAYRLNYDIACVLCRLKAGTGRDFLICSRSDSTLRGHFPAETDALSCALAEHGLPVRGVVLSFFFEEGGRRTVGGTHYVKTGDALLPAAQTESARDRTFGYRSSRLDEYVEEKTAGRVPASAVKLLTLDTIRQGGAQEVLDSDAPVVACDGENMEDMERLADAILSSAAGKNRRIIRCAASVVRALLGQKASALLPPDALKSHSPYGGLIVAGSHTARTTAQLDRLKPLDPAWFELDVTADPGSQTATLTKKCEEALGRGETAVLYTSRTLLAFDDPKKSLDFSVSVSAALTSVVREIGVMPRFLIAKGGITSYDIGVKGLGIRRARAAGQALPGVPVWHPSDGRFPGLPYIIFPGNVGDENALADLVGPLQK